MDDHRDDVVAASGTPSARGCFNCVQREGDTPMRCGLLRGMRGEPAVCTDERTDTGRCGVEGVYWRGGVPGASGNIILFPGERRMAWPKAGSFDGGSAA